MRAEHATSTLSEKLSRVLIFNMTLLFSKPTPLSRHLKPDRSQQFLVEAAIAHPMTSRRTCLCCATVLLRHLRQGGLYWRCSDCHTDMPVL